METLKFLRGQRCYIETPLLRRVWVGSDVVFRDCRRNRSMTIFLVDRKMLVMRFEYRLDMLSV